MPPRFFITHSWTDNAFAQRLCDDLRRSGLDGFFDVYSIKPGDRIPSEISRGLEACEVYVPILSRRALASKWCGEEIDAALTLSNTPGRNGRPRIVAVLAEDCQDDLPVLLRSRLHINFVGRYDEALKDLLTKGFAMPGSSGKTAKLTFFIPHYYFAQGDANMARGEFDRAAEDYSKILAVEPDNLQALYKRGLAYEANHQKAEAIADWGHYLRVAPDDAFARLVRTNLRQLRAQ